MPFTFFNTNREDSRKSNQSTDNAKGIELQQMGKRSTQTHISQVPSDAMSIVFDYVKAVNVKTYRSVVPLVSKQWRGVVRQKDQQLMKLPAIRDVELILATYLRDTEKNQTLRDLIPYRKDQRETNINRLLQLITDKLSTGKSEELLAKLHMIINNTDNEAEKSALTTVWNTIVNAVSTMDELQSHIKKSIALNFQRGAYPAHDNKLSMTERLIMALYNSKKSTPQHKIFALDCLLTGFENNNYKIDWRIDQLNKMIRDFSNTQTENSAVYEDTITLISRYHAVKARYTSDPVVIGVGPVF